MNFYSLAVKASIDIAGCKDAKYSKGNLGHITWICYCQLHKENIRVKAQAHHRPIMPLYSARSSGSLSSQVPLEGDFGDKVSLLLLPLARG